MGEGEKSTPLEKEHFHLKNALSLSLEKFSEIANANILDPTFFNLKPSLHPSIASSELCEFIHFNFSQCTAHQCNGMRMGRKLQK